MSKYFISLLILWSLVLTNNMFRVKRNSDTILDLLTKSGFDPSKKKHSGSATPAAVPQTGLLISQDKLSINSGNQQRDKTDLQTDKNR